MTVINFPKKEPYLQMEDIAIGIKKNKNELVFNIGSSQNPLYLQREHNSFTPFRGDIKTVPEILNQDEITAEKFFLLREFENTLPTLLQVPKLSELYFSYEHIMYDNPSMAFMRIEDVNQGKLIGSSYSFDVVNGDLRYSIHNEKYFIGIDLYHTLLHHRKDEINNYEEFFGEEHILKYLHNTGNLNALKRACDISTTSDLFQKIFPQTAKNTKKKSLEEKCY